ncbi:RNA polymerase sporulation sigma factor SigH [Pseudogracilibacillus sp. ICA-222130]|uniref:RNA polymerase sporulation sigma factor SigH n=1 Tax=Pseudogracilibacillus sp. ICA-222130 TaxID=3134655 RepID=UPI0030BFA8A2
MDQLDSQLPIGALVDEEMLMQVQQGDEVAAEYLVNKYENIVHKKANAYFLVGSEREDVVQEGFIGLFKAIYDYDKNKRSSFKTFAELCITRQIITSIKSATRMKHSPLNSYISIYKPVSDDEHDRTLLDTIVDDGAFDPKDYVLTKEKLRTLKVELLKALTKLEWSVLTLYLQGFSYEEIASALKRTEKSIDNALQRVKKKVEQIEAIREKE